MVFATFLDLRMELPNFIWILKLLQFSLIKLLKLHLKKCISLLIIILKA